MNKNEENKDFSLNLKEGMRVAIVHDFLVQYGGAEKVLEALCEMFPEAPIYTLLYDKEKMRGKFGGREIRPSYLQKFPKFLRKKYRYLIPFMPAVPETFDLREFDLVISSSGAWSKGIVTKLDTIHIAYVHSPMRFVWDYNGKYLKSINKRVGIFKKILLNYLRIWDREAADRPDYLIANSRYTQERIRKYYRRESEVIYPPVEKILNYKFQILDKSQIQNSKFQTNSKFKIQNSKFFLVVSRLSPYKKVDLIVEAFNKLELPLIVIGEGQQLKYLRSIAKNNVKILGWKKEEELKEYYQNARAFIFPAEDDFGITMAEAMGYGKPVIAYRGGGALEVVEEGSTGEFFDAQIMEVFADGVRRFIENEDQYDPAVIMDRARKFSKEKFKEKIMDFISRVASYKSNY